MWECWIEFNIRHLVSPQKCYGRLECGYFVFQCLCTYRRLQILYMGNLLTLLLPGFWIILLVGLIWTKQIIPLSQYFYQCLKCGFESSIFGFPDNFQFWFIKFLFLDFLAKKHNSKSVRLFYTANVIFDLPICNTLVHLRVVTKFL